MAIIQISKIQLRRGPEVDLPGQPLTLSPLSFEPGLDIGELAFTTDSGRLFIGHDPAEGHANFERTSFPYENIEVLTENSGDFIETLLLRMNREITRESFLEASLPANDGVWAPVIVARPGEANYEYRINGAGAISATIEYTAFGADGAPVRIGELTLAHGVGAAEPSVIDDAYTTRRLEVADPDSYSAEELFNSVEFRFVEAGPVGARYLVFQFTNRTEEALTLQFRVSNPKV